MTDEHRTRAWLWAGRVFFAAILLIGAAAAFAGVEFWIVVPVVVVFGLLVSQLLDPRRSWWGEEPKAILTDPKRRSEYRRRELPVFGLILVVVLVGTFAFGFVASFASSFVD